MAPKDWAGTSEKNHHIALPLWVCEWMYWLFHILNKKEKEHWPNHFTPAAVPLVSRYHTVLLSIYQHCNTEHGQYILCSSASSSMPGCTHNQCHMTTASIDTDKTANYDMQTDQVITCVSVGYALPATSDMHGLGRVSNVSCSKNVAFGQRHIAYYQLLIQTGIGIQTKEYHCTWWMENRLALNSSGPLNSPNNILHHWTLLFCILLCFIL